MSAAEDLAQAQAQFIAAEFSQAVHQACSPRPVNPRILSLPGGVSTFNKGRRCASAVHRSMMARSSSASESG